MAISKIYLSGGSEPRPVSAHFLGTSDSWSPRPFLCLFLGEDEEPGVGGFDLLGGMKYIMTQYDKVSGQKTSILWSIKVITYFWKTMIVLVIDFNGKDTKKNHLKNSIFVPNISRKPAPSMSPRRAVTMRTHPQALFCSRLLSKMWKNVPKPN